MKLDKTHRWLNIHLAGKKWNSDAKLDAWELQFLTDELKEIRPEIKLNAVDCTGCPDCGVGFNDLKEGD